MSISIPMEKILSMQSTAMLLKESLYCSSQNVKKIYRNVLDHSPCSFQAPANELQFVKNLVLRNSLNPIEAYDKEAYLLQGNNFRFFILWLEDLVQQGTLSRSLAIGRDKVALG